MASLLRLLIVVLHQLLLCWCSLDAGFFAAAQTTTGDTLWNVTLGLGDESHPATIWHDLVFPTVWTTKKMYVLNRFSGDKLWEYNSGYGIAGQTIVYNKSIYFCVSEVGGIRRVSIGDKTNTARYGSHWNMGSPTHCRTDTQRYPQLDESNCIYALPKDRQLVCLDPWTMKGKKITPVIKCSSPIYAVPGTCTFFFRSLPANKIEAHDYKGALLWEYPVQSDNGCHWSVVYDNENHLVLFPGARSDGIFALNASTGRIVWHVPINGTGPRGLSFVSAYSYFPLIYFHLFIFVADGILHAFDKRSGAPIWAVDDSLTYGLFSRAKSGAIEGPVLWWTAVSASSPANTFLLHAIHVFTGDVIFSKEFYNSDGYVLRSLSIVADNNKHDAHEDISNNVTLFFGHGTAFVAINATIPYDVRERYNLRDWRRRFANSATPTASEQTPTEEQTPTSSLAPTPTKSESSSIPKSLTSVTAAASASGQAPTRSVTLSMSDAEKSVSSSDGVMTHTASASPSDDTHSEPSGTGPSGGTQQTMPVETPTRDTASASMLSHSPGSLTGTASEVPECAPGLVFVMRTAGGFYSSSSSSSSAQSNDDSNENKAQNTIESSRQLRITALKQSKSAVVDVKVQQRDPQSSSNVLRYVDPWSYLVDNRAATAASQQQQEGFFSVIISGQQRSVIRIISVKRMSSLMLRFKIGLVGNGDSLDVNSDLVLALNVSSRALGCRLFSSSSENDDNDNGKKDNEQNHQDGDRTRFFKTNTLTWQRQAPIISASLLKTAQGVSNAAVIATALQGGAGTGAMMLQRSDNIRSVLGCSPAAEEEDEGPQKLQNQESSYSFVSSPSQMRLQLGDSTHPYSIGTVFGSTLLLLGWSGVCLCLAMVYSMFVSTSSLSSEQKKKKKNKKKKCGDDHDDEEDADVDEKGCFSLKALGAAMFPGAIWTLFCVLLDGMMRAAVTLLAAAQAARTEKTATSSSQEKQHSGDNGSGGAGSVDTGVGVSALLIIVCTVIYFFIKVYPRKKKLHEENGVVWEHLIATKNYRNVDSFGSIILNKLQWWFRGDEQWSDGRGAGGRSSSHYVLRFGSVFDDRRRPFYLAGFVEVILTLLIAIVTAAAESATTRAQCTAAVVATAALVAFGFAFSVQLTFIMPFENLTAVGSATCVLVECLMVSVIVFLGGDQEKIQTTDNLQTAVDVCQVSLVMFLAISLSVKLLYNFVEWVQQHAPRCAAAWLWCLTTSSSSAGSRRSGGRALLERDGRHNRCGQKQQSSTTCNASPLSSSSSTPLRSFPQTQQNYWRFIVGWDSSFLCHLFAFLRETL